MKVKREISHRIKRIKADAINHFLEKLNQDRNECKQAKDYISRFGFIEIEKYLEGRQDCLSGLIEQNYTSPTKPLKKRLA